MNGRDEEMEIMDGHDTTNESSKVEKTSVEGIDDRAEAVRQEEGFQDDEEEEDDPSLVLENQTKLRIKILEKIRDKFQRMSVRETLTRLCCSKIFADLSQSFIAKQCSRKFSSPRPVSGSKSGYFEFDLHDRCHVGKNLRN